MTYRIFLSSVQREFSKERKALADYIRKDAILGRFFDVFLFEEVPAQERMADDVCIGEVDAFLNRGYIEKAGTGTEDMIAKCAEWGIPAPEWIEDDDDFRVVLRRPVDWNEGTPGSDGVLSRTTQETTQQTTQETLKKSRDRNGGKSRDRSFTRTLEYKGKSDNPQNAGVAKSRDRNVTKSRDRRHGCTTQETTQQTTQDVLRKEMGGKRSDKSKHVIVALIERFPKIKQTEMAKATGLSVKGVEKVLAQLKAANVIVRVGGKRFGQWQICKQEPTP